VTDTTRRAAGESARPQTAREWLANADPTTAEHWSAAAQHRLLVQRCTRCGHHQFYPRPFCLACESRDVGWQQVSGYGQVYSMTTVRIPVHPGLPPPYVVALVELDEGPRLLTNLVGDCAIGARVQVRWQERDDLVLPLFERVEPCDLTAPSTEEQP
jgi:uncharacterized OB-fold protein